MPQFPIRIRVKPYGGSKEILIRRHSEKLNLARQIEEYLNSQENGESQMFSYSGIAGQLGCEKKQVYDILMPICGGSNGITICRRQVDS